MLHHADTGRRDGDHYVYVYRSPDLAAERLSFAVRANSYNAKLRNSDLSDKLLMT